MSASESPKLSKSASTSPCQSIPSSTTPFPLKHQHSFEQRYAAIINQQILEKTINKAALRRQVEVFFPFSRSSSKESTEEKKVENKETDNSEQLQDNEVEELEVKILQKLETLDIQDKEET